jgi:hypothetical protein
MARSRGESDREIRQEKSHDARRGEERRGAETQIILKGMTEARRTAAAPEGTAVAGAPWRASARREERKEPAARGGFGVGATVGVGFEPTPTAGLVVA